MMNVLQCARRSKAHINRMMAANYRMRNGLPLLLALVLGGCSAPATTNSAVAPNNIITTQKSAAQLLEAARTGPASERSQNLLEAADVLLRQDQPEQAEPWIKELGGMALPVAQRGRYKELLARLQLRQGNAEQALATLQDRQLLQDIDQFPTATQVDISLLRAKALALTGNHYASAQERVFVAPLLNEKQREQNQKEIWRALMYLDTPDLENYRGKTANEQLRGWIDLALITKNNQNNASAQAAQIGQWSKRWASHPAATQMPVDLVLAREVAANQPKQVALLLPLSGKLAAFGSAVRDGFMAAWYDAREQGGNPPAVRIYDTEAGMNFFPLYQQAIAEGAEIIVGPLEKAQVAALYQQTLTVPTLALNRADLGVIAPANLYQFSLAPEDEAAQIADIARQENRRRVLIIAPEDEQQSRELQVFLQRWQSNGGEIAATALYTNQQSLGQTIKAALNIPRSEARAKEMQNLLGRNVEFSARRRRDVDMVFMLAKPQQARSIKPLLAYYFAGDIPVYALSRIYNGYPNPGMDRDMDKVRFTEMPWVLDQNPLKARIVAAQPQSKNYLRLYALGVDSFHLYPRLQQMEKLNDSRVYGQTGYLTLTPQMIVQRELLLAEMRNGKPEPVPTALLRDDPKATAMESPIGQEAARQ